MDEKSYSHMANILTMEQLQQSRQERDYFQRWLSFYENQAHEELLDELVSEHDQDFPLRRSGSVVDRMRHRALIVVLDKRAQTGFLRAFLREINRGEMN